MRSFGSAGRDAIVSQVVETFEKAQEQYALVILQGPFTVTPSYALASRFRRGTD